MSAGMHFRATPLIEIEVSVNYCLDNFRVAHLYLHEGRWVITSEPQNSMADDKVGEWKWVPRSERAKQQLDIDKKVVEAMKSELT